MDTNQSSWSSVKQRSQLANKDLAAGSTACLDDKLYRSWSFNPFTNYGTCMRYGTIIKYFPDKLFGFIRPDVGQDVFFHISALEAGESHPEITPGQPVKYELTPRKAARPDEDKDGNSDRRRTEQPRAKQVVMIERIPGGKLDESAQSGGLSRHPKSRRKKPTWRR